MCFFSFRSGTPKLYLVQFWTEQLNLGNLRLLLHRRSHPKVMVSRPHFYHVKGVADRTSELIKAFSVHLLHKVASYKRRYTQSRHQQCHSPLSPSANISTLRGIDTVDVQIPARDNDLSDSIISQGTRNPVSIPKFSRRDVFNNLFRRCTKRGRVAASRKRVSVASDRLTISNSDLQSSSGYNSVQPSSIIRWRAHVLDLGSPIPRRLNHMNEIHLQVKARPHEFLSSPRHTRHPTETEPSVSSKLCFPVYFPSRRELDERGPHQSGFQGLLPKAAFPSLSNLSLQSQHPQATISQLNHSGRCCCRCHREINVDCRPLPPLPQVERPMEPILAWINELPDPVSSLSSQASGELTLRPHRRLRRMRKVSDFSHLVC
jgi:hypothetical protein